MKARKTLLILALCAGLLSACARTTLIPALNGQVVIDTDLNLTWLANANLAATETFGVSGIGADGVMNWDTAQSWIDGMNTAGYLGFNDWRLPTTLQPDATCSYQAPGYSGAYNCTGSEMGHLFYTKLGGVAGSSILSSSDPDLALFQNVQSYYYWTGTEHAPDTNFAWRFTTSNGYQGARYKDGKLFAWAVRP